MHIDFADVFLSLGTVFLASWAWLVYETSRLLNRSKHFNIPVDVIVVLGSRIYRGKHYHPSLVARVSCASRLVDRRLSNTIIFSGGKTSNKGISEAIAMKDIFQRISNNNSVSILTEARSKSTKGNLYYVKEIMKRHSMKTVAIVTEEYHAPRALRIAKRLGLNAFAVSNTMSPLWKKWKFFSYRFLRETLFCLPDLLMK